MSIIVYMSTSDTTLAEKQRTNSRARFSLLQRKELSLNATSYLRLLQGKLAVCVAIQRTWIYVQ